MATSITFIRDGFVAGTVYAIGDVATVSDTDATIAISSRIARYTTDPAPATSESEVLIDLTANMTTEQKTAFRSNIGATDEAGAGLNPNNAALTGTTSVQVLSPDIADLGTVASGTVTLSSTKAVNKVILSGSAATIALPSSPPDGWRSLVASVTGSVALTVTTPSLLRLDDPALGTVTAVSVAAASAGKVIFSFLALGGSYVGMAVLGDDSSIPSSKLAGLSTDGTNASPSNSTFLSSQAYATHLAAALDALTLPYTDVTGLTQSAFLTRGTTGTGAAELGTFGSGLSFNPTTRVLTATASGASTPVEISGGTIDLDASSQFTDTISTNQAYTFTGGANGGLWFFIITATGSYSPVWPANVYGTVTQTASKTDVYAMIRSGVFYVMWRVKDNLTIDTAPPIVTDVDINTDGDELTVTFDKDVTVTDGSGFTLTMSGGAVTVSSSPTGTGTSALVFALTGRAVASGETGTLDYDGAGGIVGEVNGVAVADFTGETVDNASTYSTYLINEDFESGSAPSGWSTVSGTPNYAYTPALLGTYSLELTNEAVDCTLGADETGTLWGFMRFKPTATTNFNMVEMRNASDVVVFSIVWRADNKLRIRHGASGPTSDYNVAFSTNESVIWFRYTPDPGGSTGSANLYANANSTSETRGSSVASITTGTGGNVRKLRLIGNNTTTVIYDKVRLSRTEIIHNPT